MRKKLLLIELNEINFDFLQSYIEKYDLKYLKSICNFQNIKTESETSYAQLEPWIQWVSAHTGKNYDEHKIYRLGDIHKYTGEQIFETIKNIGFSVGAVSPMNAELRMSNPDFFIPDPWTQSKTDGSFWSNKIHNVLKQVVNDNAQGKITKRSKLFLFLALCRFSKPRNYVEYLLLAFGAFKGKRWNKALFLDLFLCDIFIKLTLKNHTDFSTLFLNSFAHIQHHYFFNSEFYQGDSINPKDHIEANYDPMKDAAFFFDNRVKDLLNSFKDYDFLFATGLSQIPYRGEKFYYRLKNHSNFLTTLGIKFNSLNKRMTRDFEVIFASNIERDMAYKVLINIKINGIMIFQNLEIREKSLFITLSYGKRISKDDFFEVGKNKIFISNHVVPVAFKNGEHCSTGYAYISKGVTQRHIKSEIKVWDIKKIIYTYFTRSQL
jgi:hypothetical protein